MAKWVSERTVDELPFQVTVQVPLREAFVEAANLRSPGGTKPMRRSYTFIPTPDVAAVSSQLAAKVHGVNLAVRARIDAEFEAAGKQQRRIEARRRDAKRRVKNKMVHGAARVPVVAKRQAVETPMTVEGGAQHARRQFFASVNACDEESANVEKELEWEGF